MDKASTDRETVVSDEGQKLQLVVWGTPDHEGQMCGRAFDILGVEPVYIDASCPTIPAGTAPDLVLLSREWSVDLRRAAAEARRRGIPVVYLMDGVIEWSYMWESWKAIQPEGTVLQPLISSDLCVIGQHPARILAALGLADRIHIVGMPRLDAVERCRIIHQDSTPEILIATARTYGHNAAHEAFVRAAIRDLKDWFCQHPEIRPIWRIEPRLAEEMDIGIFSDAPLFDELRQTSAVISFTSTVLLESMLLGIPTAQIDYRAVPQYVQTAWEIRNPEHIEGVIRELLYPPPEKLAYQETCLRDELEVSHASERLAEVIRNAAAREPDSAPAPSSSVSGALDYRQIHSHVSTFSMAPISRVQYELDAVYKLWDRDRDRLASQNRELHSMREQLAMLGALRSLRDQLSQDRLLRLIEMLGWLPGMRRTARYLRGMRTTI